MRRILKGGKKREQEPSSNLPLNLPVLVLCLIILTSTVAFGIYHVKPVITTIFIEGEIADEVRFIFMEKSAAILREDKEILQSFYDKNIRNSSWAFEHELKKMKYLHKWSEKQGIKFIEIKPTVVIKRASEKGEGYALNLSVSTNYKYAYENEDIINSFRIGTYHSMDIVKREEGWIIKREWYTDPFADSLHIDEINTEASREYILSQNPKDFSNLLERRVQAVEYADDYCGASKESDLTYNKKYKNYNSLGGDCANFASQILFEGGRFSKTYTWNYKKDGSKAWVNAQAFKNYMVYSGRASVVAHGDYNKVYKAAYKLSPGDFVAYEKNGKVTHISVVTGADSKGYTLVNSHNTDRYRVPWDLGWSNKGIKFWLVHVHF